MQNSFCKKLKTFKKILKSKIKKNSKASKYIIYEDFFTCQGFSRIVGYTFFIKKPSTLMRINGILVQIALILIVPVFMISAVLLAREGHLYFVIENVLISAILYFTLIKIYMVFYNSTAMISEIISKLDKHFYNSQYYLRILKITNFTYQILFYSTITYFCSMLILHQIYAAYKSIDVEWETVFALNLGFDLLQPVVYGIINTILIWIIFFGVCFVLCADILFANLVLILVMELNIV